MNLVPAGELKPRDFCVRHGSRMMKVADLYGRTWIARKTGCGTEFVCVSMPSSEMVDPMPPDCDSFDWQPPSRATALELAKEWLEKDSKFVGPGMLSADRIVRQLKDLIAAMELEAKK